MLCKKTRPVSCQLIIVCFMCCAVYTFFFQVLFDGDIFRMKRPAKFEKVHCPSIIPHLGGTKSTENTSIVKTTTELVTTTTASTTKLVTTTTTSTTKLKTTTTTTKKLSTSKSANSTSYVISSTTKQPKATDLPPLPKYAPKRYLSDRDGYKRYLEYLSREEPPLPKQTNAVIIVTNYRSGSSFFGELFKQHPDVFYVYEPLWPLSLHQDCTLNSQLRLDVLKNLVQCEMPDWKKIYASLPNENKVELPWYVSDCVPKSICFREETNAVCSDRHCPRTTSRIRDCMKDCGIVNLGAVNNDCRKKQMVAMKVIRICKISDIEDIVKTLPVNVKILHLIRDPRGIANSVWRIGEIKNVTQHISGTCERQLQNLRFGTEETPEWIKGKYKAFRYEDLATQPYEVTQSIYDFVGLKFVPQMKMWIQRNTQIKELPRSISRQPQPTRRKREANPFDTRRNSLQTVQKWSRQFPYTKVKEIEKVCAEIMNIAGYKSTESEDEYKNNTGVSYFTQPFDLMKITGEINTVNLQPTNS